MKIPHTIRKKMEKLKHDISQLPHVEQSEGDQLGDDNNISDKEADDENPRKESKKWCSSEAIFNHAGTIFYCSNHKPASILYPVQDDRQFYQY
ncbi:hypothetical protein FBU30_001045 [Linnemannia zychae]|nr:hypothetical protein FBU30_001045 [Linnemannia zychae]